MSSEKNYREYVRRMHKIADVKNALAVLQWDQETYLPVKGAAFRGQQMATLSEIAHGLFADESLGSLLDNLLQSGDLTPTQQRNITLTIEDYQKNKKYSGEFVRNLSESTSKCYHAWIEARKQNDFSIYKKSLEELVGLKKEETQILGFAQHPYDALLNEFEKGATVAWLDELFDKLQPPLKKLLSAVTEKPQPKDDFLHQHFDKDAQWKFGLEMLKKMGYDFGSGRQDVSAHPFTTSFNPRDVRVTTRIDEHDFTSMTWSCLHEGGHALYEQGLPEQEYGLPLGEYCSLGIHESQSRLWENCIGRSLAFVSHNLAAIQHYFPQLEKVNAKDLFCAVNKVQPSLIRTEADELTYHFHVIIRYTIEKQLIEGSLAVKDIPAAWNELYFQYLGVKVPDDKNGCLQDIHWSHGSFGYFPTYSLGSLYAAQFFGFINEQQNTLEIQIEKGNYENIHQWLQTNVYQYGRAYTSSELCNKITGKPLNLEFFLRYLTAKYNLIYTL